jgi:hypothetical protein
VDLRLYLSTYKTFIILKIVLVMEISDQHMVLLEGVFKIIFEELDRIWLARIRRGPSESHWDMLDISFMLYLLKCRI